MYYFRFGFLLKWVVGANFITLRVSKVKEMALQWFWHSHF